MRLLPSQSVRRQTVVVRHRKTKRNQCIRSTASVVLTTHPTLYHACFFPEKQDKGDRFTTPAAATFDLSVRGEKVAHGLCIAWKPAQSEKR